MKKVNKQKLPSIAIVIGLVVITIVAMVVYSNNAINLKLNFFGTGLFIEKKQ